MKLSLIFVLSFAGLLLVSCGSEKDTSQKGQTTDDTASQVPPAEVPLSPGVVEASVDIISLTEQESSTIVTAKIVEVTGYGSATEPVVPNTEVQFTMPDDFSPEDRAKIKAGQNLSVKISKIQAGFDVDSSPKTTPWKLLTIN